VTGKRDGKKNFFGERNVHEKIGAKNSPPQDDIRGRGVGHKNQLPKTAKTLDPSTQERAAKGRRKEEDQGRRE